MATTTEIDRTRALRDFGDVFVALDRLPLPVFAVASNGVGPLAEHGGGGDRRRQAWGPVLAARRAARNHVRALLRRLGVHSRLEAVTTAQLRGLI